MSNLRERCKAFLDGARRDAILRQGSPVDDLMGFVLAETGRTADPSLAETLPLVCYFLTKADREEFKTVMREFKPNMITKKMP